MRTQTWRIFGVSAALLAASVSGCAKSTTAAADCMVAMAQVMCPPGTAPVAGSGGEANTQMGGDAAIRTGAVNLSAENGQQVQCQYHCAPVCECGIQRVEADGAVLCVPCMGANAQIAQPTNNTPNPVANNNVAPNNGRPNNNDQPANNGQLQPTSNNSVVLNFNNAPLFGARDLTPPFNPDPYVVQVQAGGNEPITGTGISDPTGGSCAGFVNARQPDLSITYRGRTPMKMSIDSAADTTLIVNQPDGTWRCSDDTANNNPNPSLYFREPQTGRYDVWIGTYNSGELPAAKFLMTTNL